MPRQNRVSPFGNIIATSARGTLMGNRGCLHNAQGQVIRAHQNKRWIICQLEFKGRQRRVMSPGKYTELFFLDETTALSAGHRPCAECFHPRFKCFTNIWQQANPELVPDPQLRNPQLRNPQLRNPQLRVNTLDAILHQERLANKEKVTYTEHLANLPSGAMVMLDGDWQAYLQLEDKLLPWSPEGYGQAKAYDKNKIVQVLTPRSVVRTLAAGYQPLIHPTAFE